MADKPIYIRARCSQELKDAVLKFVADKNDEYWDESRVVKTAVEEYIGFNSTAAAAARRVRRKMAGVVRDSLKPK